MNWELSSFFGDALVDTIHILAPAFSRMPILTRAREIMDKRTSLVHTIGYHNGFRVRIDADNSVHLRGSLSNLLWNSNLSTMRHIDVREGVSLLQKIFGIEPEHTRIHRIDLAATLEMPRPVANYLGILGTTPRYKRQVTDGEGVKYIQQNRALMFYDKGKKEKIPGNLLRFEVQYQRRLQRQRIGKLYLSDLNDFSSFEQLIHGWRHEFKRSAKHNSTFLSR